jgi:hypothetical protein
MNSLVEFLWTPDSTDPLLVLPINTAGVYIPDEPVSLLGFYHKTVATPRPLLSQIREAIAKSDRGIFKLGSLLDPPLLGTSDPRREFLDSRGNVQCFSFKSFLIDLPMSLFLGGML